jgi:hypothetical protein
VALTIVSPNAQLKSKPPDSAATKKDPEIVTEEPPETCEKAGETTEIEGQVSADQNGAEQPSTSIHLNSIGRARKGVRLVVVNAKEERN